MRSWTISSRSASTSTFASVSAEGCVLDRREVYDRGGASETAVLVPHSLSRGCDPAVAVTRLRYGGRGAIRRDAIPGGGTTKSGVPPPGVPLPAPPPLSRFTATAA